MSQNNQSLDDTLKELLQEPAEAKNTEDALVEKPKRKRRTKAQIEADKKAEEAKASNDAQSAKNELSKDIQLDESAKPEEGVSEPAENILDTAEDLQEDVVEPELKIEEQETPVEVLEPEIVPDNEADAEPDIVEPKEEVRPRQRPVPGEAIEAFQDVKSVEPAGKYIGKSGVLINAVPTYRAPHKSMRMKSYRGFVTVIEDPRNGFIKVQFLRQGFGLCSAYMDADVVISLFGGD